MITILLNTLLLLVNSIQIIGEVSHSKTQFSECNHENKKNWLLFTKELLWLRDKNYSTFAFQSTDKP
jgi:hypothetical protein